MPKKSISPTRLKRNFVAQSTAETEKLGHDLAAQLRGQNLFLFGELGVGKTTFLRGLAAGFGVRDKVKSPTFVYEKIYKVKRQVVRAGLRQAQPDKEKAQNDREGQIFAHFDFYRLDSIGPEMSERLRELFTDSNTTVAVEWSERLPKSWLPKKRVELRFAELENGARKIKIQQIE